MTVKVEQNQFKTYVVTEPKTRSQIKVVPERGGIITAWQVDDTDLLYLDHERFADPSKSVRGGIPVLFPICGNLPENLYVYSGHEYTLKQHGFARDLPWQVISQATEATDTASIALELTSNAQTLAAYPFEFRLVHTYAVIGNQLKITQSFTNLSHESMPFATGFHPYFAIADKYKLTLDIPANQFWDHLTHSDQTYTGSLDFDADEIDIAFKELFAASASATDGDRQLKISLSYDSCYSTLVFWTVKGKDYFCLEPWTAPRNALNSGESIISLEPGASQEMSIRLSVDFHPNG
jgi:galactose mutarotase-like enzyme